MRSCNSQGLMSQRMECHKEAEEGLGGLKDWAGASI